MRLDGAAFRIIGVLDEWRLTPTFYDITSSRYGEPEQVFVPFSTSRDLKMSRSGNMNCWDGGDTEDDPEGQTGVNASCVWIQYWVELEIGRESWRERVWSTWRSGWSAYN